ncbi:MAG: hypothetical protein L6R41_001690 [Letrouitia leprolyta]|nr:MAG: hypothetical protein L6R41_001690 [Letrouitia leprolyta]
MAADLLRLKNRKGDIESEYKVVSLSKMDINSSKTKTNAAAGSFGYWLSKSLEIQDLLVKRESSLRDNEEAPELTIFLAPLCHTAPLDRLDKLDETTQHTSHTSVSNDLFSTCLSQYAQHSTAQLVLRA